MNELLFYRYLNFQKNKNKEKRSWKNIFSLPLHIRLWTIALFLLVIATFVFAFILNLKPFSYISSLITAILSAVIYVITERFQLKTNDKKMDKYQRDCEDLNKWIKQNDITSDDKIQLTLEQFKESIDENVSELKRPYDRLDKWMQMLIAPIAAAIVASVMSKGTNLQDSILNSLNLIFIFVVAYYLIRTMINIMQIPDKRKINQMKDLVNNLQGLLNLHSINNTTAKGKENIVKVKKYKKSMTERAPR